MPAVASAMGRLEKLVCEPIKLRNQLTHGTFRDTRKNEERAGTLILQLFINGTPHDPGDVFAEAYAHGGSAAAKRIADAVDRWVAELDQLRSSVTTCVNELHDAVVTEME